MHYQRWLRNGAPTKGSPPRDGAPLRHLLALIERWELSLTDECVDDWPHARSKDGYPSVPSGIRSGSRRASHIVLERTGRGPRPDGMECRHVCGDARCLNPRHLAWGTPKENCADKAIHGTQPRGERHPSARLTEKAVREIRQRYVRGNRWHRGNSGDLATEYGVSANCILAAGRRATWRWLD